MKKKQNILPFYDSSRRFLKNCLQDYPWPGRKRPFFEHVVSISITHGYWGAVDKDEVTHNNLVEIASAIPKDSTKHFNRPLQVLEEQKINVRRDYSKERCEKPGELLNLIRSCVKQSGKPVILMDHGGYGAPDWERLVQYGNETGNFIGAIEFTLNGEQRFKRALQSNPNIKSLPILSVANSVLKAPADKQSGRLIANEIQHILISEMATNCQNISIGVIGFGRLGSELARAFQSSKCKGVYIYDCDPVKLIQAPVEGFQVRQKEVILKNCDLIVSASGNQAILPEDYSLMKDGVVIASVTSADDEFRLPELIAEGTLKSTSDIQRESMVSYFHTLSGKMIHFITNGESPKLPGGLGAVEIWLPTAEYLILTGLLISEPNRFHSGLQESPLEVQNYVSQKWLEEVAGLNMSILPIFQEGVSLL